MHILQMDTSNQGLFQELTEGLSISVPPKHSPLILGAFDQSLPLGVLIADVGEGRCLIKSLYVNESARGQGCASALVDKLMELIQKTHLEIIWTCFDMSSDYFKALSSLFVHRNFSVSFTHGRHYYMPYSDFTDFAFLHKLEKSGKSLPCVKLRNASLSSISEFQKLHHASNTPKLGKDTVTDYDPDYSFLLIKGDKVLGALLSYRTSDGVLVDFLQNFTTDFTVLLNLIRALFSSVIADVEGGVADEHFTISADIYAPKLKAQANEIFDANHSYDITIAKCIYRCTTEA